MSHSLQSVVGFAELAKQMQKRSAKKGFDFTLMVVGESGLGKSTMINSLFLQDLYSDRIIPTAAERSDKTVEISTATVDIQENAVHLRLTIVDTPGFADAVDNEACWKPIIDYIDRQYDSYLRDESGLNRRNIVDNRVHCCLYFISPSGHGLRPLDIEVMKKLDDKVNIIPVIGKADMLTKNELHKMKKKILSEIQENGIRIYQGGETDEEENHELKSCTPFAVVSSNQVLEVGGKKVRGRLYPWGVVEVENPKHSEFPQLRNILMRTHMQDLKEVTVGIHYENFRSSRLANTGQRLADGTASSPPPPEADNVASKLAEKEQELERMRAMMDMMKKQMQLQGGGANV